MSNQIVTTDATAAILGEICGGAQPEVQMMIGIGLVKDSEAVFFQYLGDDRAPQALMMPSGKPVTRISSVTLTGIDVAEGIGEFNSTKLNVFFTTGEGRTLMLTSGLTTLWSQCVLTGLVEVLNSGDMSQPMSLDSWKGTSKMKPCFAAVRQGGEKMSNTDLYNDLANARATKSTGKQMDLLKDAVDVIKGYFGEVPADVVVTVEEDGTDY